MCLILIRFDQIVNKRFNHSRAKKLPLAVYFFIFLLKVFYNMAEISISNKDWQRVKIKIQRKYNHLTDEQLQYTEGQEEGLIKAAA